MATMTMDFGGSRMTRPALRAVSTTAAAPVRLTARGRLVLRLALATLVALLTFVLLSLGSGAVVSALTTAPAVSSGHSVVVRSGETLWQIAARELPGLDPREGIARIRTLNGMTAADMLVAGATLDIPTV